MKGTFICLFYCKYAASIADMRHVYLIKSLYVFLLNVTHIKKPHPACRVKFAQLLKICLSLTDIILMNQQLKKCREHSAYKYMLKLRVNRDKL